MLVVFPVPLIPKKIIVYGGECFFISSIRFGGFCKTSEIEFFSDSEIVFPISPFFTDIPTRSSFRFSRILSTTSNATLFSKRINSRGSRNSSTCSCETTEVVSFVFSFEKKEGLASSLSELGCCMGFSSEGRESKSSSTLSFPVSNF